MTEPKRDVCTRKEERIQLAKANFFARIAPKRVVSVDFSGKICYT